MAGAGCRANMRTVQANPDNFCLHPSYTSPWITKTFPGKLRQDIKGRFLRTCRGVWQELRTDRAGVGTNALR